MDLAFHFDRSPGAAPLYDCDDKEEALTYDWGKRKWTDAKTLDRDDRCYGLNGTGSERVMALTTCEALMELQEDGAEGLVVIPWYWHNGQLLLSLIFFSRFGERLSAVEFPEWFPFETLDHDSLLVGSVMLA